jgi:hypothetical protein
VIVLVAEKERAAGELRLANLEDARAAKKKGVSNNLKSIWS